MEMDCYSFQSNVSPLDIQMLYDLPSYSKTISFPTINQDDIYMIWDCRFLRKLSVIIFSRCGCLGSMSTERKPRNQREMRRKRHREKEKN